MKQIKFVVLGLLAAAAVTAQAANGTPGIAGSAHDFSTNSWNTFRSLCGPCHTMHGSTDQLIPLWSHDTTKASFTMYDSPTFNAKGTTTQPGAASKACLSCHDGTVAINSYGGRTGTDFITNPDALIGPDLSNDHPISFTYDANLVAQDGFLKDPTTTTVPQLAGRTVDQSMLNNHKMECTSCHDIHRQKGNSMNSGVYVIIGGNSQPPSALCLTCHNK